MPSQLLVNCAGECSLSLRSKWGSLFTERALIGLLTQGSWDRTRHVQIRLDLTGPTPLFCFQYCEAGREKRTPLPPWSTPWKRVRTETWRPETSPILLSSSQLYNLSFFFPWGEDNKEKGGTDPKWKQSCLPAYRHEEVKPTYSWKAKILVILHPSPITDIYLSTTTWLCKLCNLTLDTTKPSRFIGYTIITLTRKIKSTEIPENTPPLKETAVTFAAKISVILLICTHHLLY